MANCYDQVIVRDGQYSSSKQLASYCGSWYSSAVVVPSGRYARVEFTSKSYYSAKGFLLSIRFTDFRYQTTAAPYTQWPTTPYRCKWSLATTGAESSRESEMRDH